MLKCEGGEGVGGRWGMELLLISSIHYTMAFWLGAN